MTRRQHTLSKVSEVWPHLGLPRVEEGEQQERTSRPDTRVPDPGHRQFSTRHRAADLYSTVQYSKVQYSAVQYGAVFS